MTKSAVLVAGLALFLAAGASAQPVEQKQNVVRAEAPVVAGNALNAKKRALADAFRQAAEQVYAEIIKEEPLPSPTPPGVAQLRASLASSAQRFVRSYRLVDQQTEDGVLRVMVEVDIDAALLRRELDRARGTGTANLQPAVQPVAKLVLVAGTAPAAPQIVAALTALGVRAQLDRDATQPAKPAGSARDPGAAEAPLLANAARLGASALFVSATSSAEDPVRGAFRIPVKCSLAWRLFGAGAQAARGPAVARTDEDYGFAIEEAGARKMCFETAAGIVARAAAAALRAPMTAATYVTLKLEIADVGAIPFVQQALKRIGSATANEIRHIASNAVEIRVFTRIGGPALFQALARELGGKLVLTPVQTAVDLVEAKARGADAPPSE